MKTFTLYADPSHGWLKVSAKDVNEVGLSSISFSRYSFFKNNANGWADFYLEEDMDATLFIAAYKVAYGEEPVVRESLRNTSSPIRRYERLEEGFSYRERLNRLQDLQEAYERDWDV